MLLLLLFSMMPFPPCHRYLWEDAPWWQCTFAIVLLGTTNLHPPPNSTPPFLHTNVIIFFCTAGLQPPPDRIPNQTKRTGHGILIIVQYPRVDCQLMTCESRPLFHERVIGGVGGREDLAGVGSIGFLRSCRRRRWRRRRRCSWRRYRRRRGTIG